MALTYNPTLRKYLPVDKWIKLIITIGFGFILYRQIFVQSNLQQLQEVFLQHLNTSNGAWLIIVFALMPVNWILEISKWRLITRSFMNESWLNSTQIVMAGVAVGVITPSRIGEYGGRFYMVEASARWKSLSATFLTSLAQNIVTILFGLFGIIYIINQNREVYTSIYFSVLIPALLIFFTLTLIYWNPLKLSRIISYVNRFYLNNLFRFEKHVEFCKNVSRLNLLKVLVVSAVRYKVYAFQYLLLLYFFGIDIGMVHSLCIIAVIWLIQTGIPLPPLLGIIGRGEIAVWMWSQYTENTLGILAVTFLLWMINLIAPALTGWLVIMNRNDENYA